MRHSRRPDSIGAETPPLEIAPPMAASPDASPLHPDPPTAALFNGATPSAEQPRYEEDERLDRAVNLLRRTRPVHSAAEPIWMWQLLSIALLSGTLVLGVSLATRPALAALLIMLALPFFCVVLLRAFALWHASWSSDTGREPKLDGDRNTTEHHAPYTVLVPLFREVNVIPDLVAALSALEYPTDRLQIIFITESIDHETQSALATAGLATHMRVVVVPDGAPRTKPRALNFALSEATGDYVVVYDAEDIPERDQLRRALCRLRATPRLGCVQACWMQTYLVHMREPFRLVNELGLRSFIGLQLLMGGLLLSALVHPWFYALALLDAVYGILAVPGNSLTGRMLWWLGLFNLVTGYATGVALGCLAVWRRGRGSLAAHTMLMPVYWLLISYAAYRALWQLVAAPFYWEKTEHRPRANTAPELVRTTDMAAK